MLLTFFGLHFDGAIDATGVATVFLAVVTAALAWFTRDAVQQGATELAQSQRPVLLPYRDGGNRPTLFEDEPGLPKGVFVLPVVNVGVGPAMAITAQVEFGDIDAQPTAAPWVQTWAERTAVGAGEKTGLLFEGVPLTGMMGFVFNIEFSDVAGRSWFARGYYSEREHRFFDYEVVEGSLGEGQKFRLVPRAGHA
jgi:hypothetical protein